MYFRSVKSGTCLVTDRRLSRHLSGQRSISGTRKVNFQPKAPKAPKICKIKRCINIGKTEHVGNLLVVVSKLANFFTSFVVANEFANYSLSCEMRLRFIRTPIPPSCMTQLTTSHLYS